MGQSNRDKNEFKNLAHLPSYRMLEWIWVSVKKEETKCPLFFF
jgi:hypothetical protein